MTPVGSWLRLADEFGLSAKIRGQLALRLTLRSLKVELVFPEHVGAEVSKAPTSHTRKNHGNQMRRHSSL